MDFAGMKRRELQALCKRHGLPAGGTNAALIARLDAALSVAAGAEEEEEVVVEVEARKGCLKRLVGDAGEAKKVTFAVEESKGRRLRSRVVWSPVVAKTKGKRAEAGTDSAADGGVSAEADANVPVRRSRRKSLTAAEAVEVEEAVTVDRKRKQRSQEVAEEVAVSAQVEVSRRVTRRSSLSGTTVLLPPAVEKKRGSAQIEVSRRATGRSSLSGTIDLPPAVERKRGRGKAAGVKNDIAAEEQVAEAQDSSAAASPTVVESKRSRRKGANCEPYMQKSAKVEASARTTKSVSVEAFMMSPAVVGNKKRRKTGDAQPDVELPRNDAPVTRSLRNRVVQANDSGVEETHTGKQLENKMQSSRPTTRRHQQVASSVVEEQAQVAAPSKGLPLRRAGRNNSEVSNASSAPVEAKDSNVAQPLTHHNPKVEDVEKQPAVKEPVRRSTRKSLASALLEKDKDLTIEKNTEAHVRRSKRKSTAPAKDIEGSGKEVQNAKGEDVVEQQTIKEPVRRSTRKSVASNMIEKEKDLIAEKNPEIHVRRSLRKSIVPVKDTKGVGAEGEDIPKQPPLKEPVRRSRRSVAAVVLEEQNKDLHEEKKSEIPTRRSTRKSIALNAVEKGNMDHTEIVGRDRLGVGTRKQKARVQLIDGTVAVATSETKLQIEVAVHNNQGVQWSTHKSLNNNLSDDNEAHHGPNKCLSRKTVSEEGFNLGKHRRSSVEISSPVNHSWNTVDFGGQEFRNQQDAQTPNEKDNTEKPVRTQHISCSTTSKRLPAKRRGTIPPEEIMSVQEAKSDDMAIGQKDSQDVNPDDVLPIDFTVGCLEEQSPVARQGNTSDILAKETDVAAVQKKITGEASASECSGKTLSGIMSTGLHTEDLQNDCDDLTKGTGEASEHALPISDCKLEFHADEIAEESIGGADVGKHLNKGSKENPLLTDLHSEEDADDSIVPVLNASKGCSLDGRDSSFDLKFLFAEDCRGSYSRNGENTADEVDCRNKPSTCVTPSFYVRPDCGLEDEDGQPGGYADENLDADQCIAQEVVVAKEKSNDENIAAGTDLNTKLNDKLLRMYMESDCSIAEKNKKLVALNPDDGQATVQVQQGDVQEGNLEKASLCSATPECTHECGLPKETVPHSMSNKGYLSSASQSPFGIRLLFSPENIGESVGYSVLASATAHTANGVDQLEDRHVNCALEKTQSELVSLHDSHEGSSLVSKSNDCISTFQQDNGIEGLPQTSHGEEWVSSSMLGFQANANNIKEVINSEEVICTSEESRKPVQSEDIGSVVCEKSDVNGPDDNAYGISGAVLSSSPPGPANDNDDICLCYTSVQLESTGFLDEKVGCSNTEVQHQGHKYPCNDDREEQDAFEPYVNDVIEAATAKYIESGMALLPAEERSNLQDGQLNSEFEGTKVVESDLNFNKDVSNTLDNIYVVGIGGERTSSGSSLSKDSSTDHYMHQEFLDGLSVETTLEGSAMLGKKIVSRVGTTGNPSFGLATPDYKHEGALSEEAVRTIKNYAGTRSSNPRELLMELQSLFSKENIEGSYPHDGLASPSPGSGVDESANVEQWDTQYGSNLSQLESTDLLDEPIGCSDTEVQHQGYRDQSNGDHDEQNPLFNLATPDYKHEGALSEEAVRTMKNYPGACSSDPKQLLMELQPLFSKGSIEKSDLQNSLAFQSAESGRDEPAVCHVTELVDTPVSSESDTYQDNEHKGLLQPNHMKNDQHHLPEECHIVSWPKQEIPNGLSVPRRPEESANCQDDSVSESGPCQTSGQQCINESSSMQATSDIEAFNQDHEDNNANNEGQITPGITAGSVSEAADIERSERETGLTAAAGTSVLPVEQLNTKVGGNLVDEHCCSYDKGTLSLFNMESTNIKASSLHKDTRMDPSVEENPPNYLSAPISPEEPTVLVNESVPGSAGPCQTSGQQCINESSSMQTTSNIEAFNQDHEESNENNEGQITPSITASSVSEAADIKRSEREIGLTTAAGTSALPDEQLNTKVEGNVVDGRCCSYDEGTSSLFDIESLNIKASSVHANTHMDPSVEENPPNDLSAPRSPEESTVFQNNSVPGSAGICQSSRRRGIDELRANLQSFKVSSTVKGSYIAMSAPRPKQGGNLSQSAITMLRNRENTPDVKPQLAKPDLDCSVAKDLFDIESRNIKASSLPEDTHMDPSVEENPPNDLSAPRSPEESMVFQNNSVPGSVGICQSSRRRGIDELRAKLQSFKVSSTVKGSYIAMSAPRPKQGDNLTQSAIAMLRNRENTLAVKPDHPAKPDPDPSVAKDASRRALQPISGRPRDH